MSGRVTRDVGQEQMVVRYLRRHGPTRAEALRAGVGVGYQRYRRLMDRLHRTHQVLRCGAGRRALWRLPGQTAPPEREAPPERAPASVSSWWLDLDRGALAATAAARAGRMSASPDLKLKRSYK